MSVIQGYNSPTRHHHLLHHNIVISHYHIFVQINDICNMIELELMMLEQD